jgi:hypothetical protein
MKKRKGERGPLTPQRAPQRLTPWQRKLDLAAEELSWAPVEAITSEEAALILSVWLAETGPRSASHRLSRRGEDPSELAPADDPDAWASELDRPDPR